MSGSVISLRWYARLTCPLVCHYLPSGRDDGFCNYRGELSFACYTSLYYRQSISDLFLNFSQLKTIEVIFNTLVRASHEAQYVTIVKANIPIIAFFFELCETYFYRYWKNCSNDFKIRNTSIISFTHCMRFRLVVYSIVKICASYLTAVLVGVIRQCKTMQNFFNWCDALDDGQVGWVPETTESFGHFKTIVVLVEHQRAVGTRIEIDTAQQDATTHNYHGKYFFRGSRAVLCITGKGRRGFERRSLLLLQKAKLKKQTSWSESASELYRPSDRRLSVKLMPTFVDRWVSRSRRGGSPTTVM
jgi:hypothetical protein